MSSRPIIDKEKRFRGSYSVFSDITKLREVEQALRSREQELKNKARNLEELNAALNVLLKRREDEVRDFEKRILSNKKPHLSCPRNRVSVIIP